MKIAIHYFIGLNSIEERGASYSLPCGASFSRTSLGPSWNDFKRNIIDDIEWHLKHCHNLDNPKCDDALPTDEVIEILT